MRILQFIHRHMMPKWVDDDRPDAAHPHRRRFTAAYRRRQGLVKNIWIGSGLIMIALAGLPHAIFGIALGTAFLSFMILDECE